MEKTMGKLIYMFFEKAAITDSLLIFPMVWTD